MKAKFLSACLMLAVPFSCQAGLANKDELLICSHHPKRVNDILTEFSFGLVTGRALAELEAVRDFIGQIDYQGERGALLFESNVIGFFNTLVTFLVSPTSHDSLHDILSTIETLGNGLTAYINAFTGILSQCQSKEVHGALYAALPSMFDLKRDLLKREKPELNAEKVKKLTEITHQLSSIQQWLNGIRTPFQDLISNPKDAPDEVILATVIEAKAKAGIVVPAAEYNCKTLRLLELGGYNVKR